MFFRPLTCWIGLFCLTFLNVWVCHFAVDLLNRKKNLFYQLKNFIYRCFSFVDLLNWSILTKISECGVMSFCCWLVELRKSFSCNSKKIDIGVCFGRWLVELDYPAISECEGMSFSCWLVELRKNLFHQLKNFIYRFCFRPLTCWIGLLWLRFPNLGVCDFPVDLLTWEKSFSPTQKFPIQTWE